MNVLPYFLTDPTQKLIHSEQCHACAWVPYLGVPSIIGKAAARSVFVLSSSFSPH